jgi:cullin-4
MMWYSNRKLMWIHNLGVVTMSAEFAKRKVDLVLSGVQATILMLFNEQTQLTVEEIQKHTGLAPDILKRQLRSLASGKYKVIHTLDGDDDDHACT